MNDSKLINEYEPLNSPQTNNILNRSHLKAKTTFMTLLPVALGIALLSMGYNAAGAILLLISPTVCLWQYISSYPSSERPDRKTLIYTYIFTGTAGLTVIAAIQLILVYAVGWLFLGSDLNAYVLEAMRSDDEITDPDTIALRFDMSRRWQYWIVILSFAFDAAACLEESLKYYAILYARRWGRAETPRDVVLVAIATALSFATIESFGWIQGAWLKNESASKFALTVLERLVFALPGHTMMAVLTALGMIAYDFKNDAETMAKILELPVLIHGSFDFLCLAVSAYNGNIGWVHPKKGPSLYFIVAVAVTWLVGQIWLVRRRLRQLGDIL